MRLTASTACRYAAPLDQLRQKSQEFEARMVSTKCQAITDAENMYSAAVQLCCHQLGPAAAHAGLRMTGDRVLLHLVFRQLARCGQRHRPTCWPRSRQSGSLAEFLQVKREERRARGEVAPADAETVARNTFGELPTKGRARARGGVLLVLSLTSALTQRACQPEQLLQLPILVVYSLLASSTCSPS